MDKLKILHLITGLEIGGAEIMLLQVLPRLTAFNHIVCSLSDIGPIGENLKNQDFPVYALLSGKKFSLKSIMEFHKIIKAEKPDIISTRLIHADIFGRIFGRLFGIKKIVCCLESILDQPKYDKYFLIERLTSFLVSKYMAVSNSVKKRYIEKAKINPDKIELIYNGIDVKKFENLLDKTSAKTALKMEKFYPLIGYIGKLRAERNHSVAIKAFLKITEKWPDARLLLVGDGPEKENLARLAEKLGIDKQVIFLGNRNDIPLILASLDIFISLSGYEGMSVAILEAMAAGCPIIASDIIPNREIIENNKDGCLVPPFEPEIIAYKIIEVADNPKLQQELRRRAEEKSKNFSIEKTVSNLEELYLSS